MMVVGGGKHRASSSHDQHSFAKNFREKSLPESLLERRFVLGSLIAPNPLTLKGKNYEVNEIAGVIAN